MSFAEFENTVLQQAQQRAEAVQVSFARQLAVEENKVKQQAMALETGIINRGEAEAERQASQLRQAAHLAARADVLSAKQAELDELGQAFADELNRATGEAGKNMMAAWLKSLPAEAGTIVPGEHHAEILRTLALRPGFELSGQAIPGEGGFLYRSARVEVNLTTSNIVAQLLVRHRAELAGIVFS